MEPYIIASNPREFIRNIMNKYPKTREDTMRLLIHTWQAQGLRLEDWQKVWLVEHGMNPETVLRARRELKGRGYWPSAPVDELFKTQE